jgi:hypothetical protein
VTVTILTGDALAELRKLPTRSVDCCVTSPPYWGLRDYGVDGQIGLERTLGEHLEVMVDHLPRGPPRPQESRHALAQLWRLLCRGAADYKADGSDDRTFRDKPFSTVGPIYRPVLNWR